MFGIDEGGHAAGLLGLGDHLQGDGGFATGFGAEDLDDAAAGHAADAQGGVKGERAGRDDRDGDDGLFAAEAHDGALAKLLFDLGQRQSQCPVAF